MGLSVLESRQTPRRLASVQEAEGLRAGTGRSARPRGSRRWDHRPAGRRRAVVRLRVHPLPRSAAVDGGPAGRRPLPAPPATGSWAGEAHRADQGGRPGALLRLPHRPLRQRDPGGHRLHPRPADRRVQPAFQSGLWGGASPPQRMRSKLFSRAGAESLADTRKFLPAARDYLAASLWRRAGLRINETVMLDIRDWRPDLGTRGKLHIRYGKGSRGRAPRRASYPPSIRSIGCSSGG